MAASNPHATSTDTRPAVASFIEHRLQDHHPMFGTSMVTLDPMSGHYTQSSQALQPTGPSSMQMGVGSPAAEPQSVQALPLRPIWTDYAAMNFWNAIFPQAMSKFVQTDAPKKPSDTSYNIRAKQDWNSVYNVLEMARNKYQEKGGKVGWLRNVRRKIADNITPGVEVAKFASKLTPNDPYATPVLGAVEILLDAIQTSTRIREKALTGFDGLIAIFSDVELFLGTFPKDEGIRNACLDLTVTILCAIEQAVRFFMRNEIRKGAKVLLSGANYEKDLVESLDDINTKSRSLMQEATKSHIHEFHMYSQETQRIYRQIVPIVATGYNSIRDLLSEHLQKKERELEIYRQENLYLRVENGILRTNSPLPQIQSAPSSPGPAATGWYMSQDNLRSLLGHADLDLGDVSFIKDRIQQLPERERVRTEQIIGTSLFQEWLVSAFSSKLLVQWDVRPPKSTAGISPLSVFCVTIAEILRSRDQFVSALWICGLHTDANEPNARIGGRAMAASFIDQLLRQFAYDMRRLENDINIADLQHASLHELLGLLEWLVRALPRDLTLVLIADGVVLFERPSFAPDALKVFSRLLLLCNDTSVAATVKVLFTSTPGTDIIRGAFEKENMILSVDGLSQLVWSASEERIARELDASQA